MQIIQVRELAKRYGERTVLERIDLDVHDGEILGILGPNGAGKTTLVECIGGLRAGDGGSIEVAGMDPRRDPRIREILGMQLQHCALPARLTPREALDLFASFHPDPAPTAELLDRFGLADHADAAFGSLSGGQQQRLSVALALVGRPRIAILDELTTGLDPVARRGIWSHLRDLSAGGSTLILVTHSLEEAQHLCDRLIVLRDGRVFAAGTADELIASAAGGAASLEDAYVELITRPEAVAR